MKQFIKYTSILVLAFLVPIIGGEYMIRTTPNTYQYKHKWMLQHAKELNTLILGSSHTFYGLRPDLLKKNTFNLANSSQGFKYDLFLLESYSQQYKNLKHVILPISYFSLFSKGFEGDNWWWNIYYKIYMDCPFYSDFSRYNFEFSHSSVYKGKLKSILSGNSQIICDSLGFGTTKPTKDKVKGWDSKENGLLAVRNHTATDWSYLNENLIFLHRIVQFCRKESIELILITTPTWKTYYEQLDQKQLAKMKEVVQSITQTYHLRYLDYLKDTRFTENDFFNCDHLSDIGAEKFTRILRSDLDFN